MKGRKNRERGAEKERERDGTLAGKPQFISAEERDFNPWFGCLCGRLGPDMKNEKVRFLAQGKRFAGTEPEEAFCASPLPQVTDRGGCETLS